jgi:hypothetical protein
VRLRVAPRMGIGEVTADGCCCARHKAPQRKSAADSAKSLGVRVDKAVPPSVGRGGPASVKGEGGASVAVFEAGLKLKPRAQLFRGE